MPVLMKAIRKAGMAMPTPAVTLFCTPTLTGRSISFAIRMERIVDELTMRTFIRIERISKAAV